MKHLLNTLFVTTPGAYLSKEGETVVVRVEHETKLQVPTVALEGIVCLGGVGFSPPLMELCADNGVTISFLTEQGRFLARVNGPVSGNILLRKEQYRRADDAEKTTALAQGFVLGKLANCRAVLLRAVRDGAEIEAGNALNTSNFTVWLTGINVTSYRIPSSGGLNLTNGTTGGQYTYNTADHSYWVNFTVPANMPGEYYKVHVSTNYYKNRSSHSGEGLNQTLLIN